MRRIALALCALAVVACDRGGDGGDDLGARPHEVRPMFACPDGTQVVSGITGQGTDLACLDDDLIWHGPYIRRTPSGALLRRGQYESGVREGVWITRSRGSGRLAIAQCFVGGDEVWSLSGSNPPPESPDDLPDCPGEP